MMTSLLMILSAALLLIIVSPTLGQGTAICDAASLAGRLDSLIEGYQDTRSEDDKLSAFEAAEALHDALGDVLDDCGDNETADDADVTNSIELEPSDYGIYWDKAKKYRMDNGCEVAYVVQDLDDVSAIGVFLKDEHTMRTVMERGLMDSDMEVLEPDMVEEGDFNGVTGLGYLYMNPTHLATYTWQYEYEGELSEVVFPFEAGITGRRTTLAGVVLECQE